MTVSAVKTLKQQTAHRQILENIITVRTYSTFIFQKLHWFKNPRKQKKEQDVGGYCGGKKKNSYCTIFSSFIAATMKADSKSK